jgi:hypothetical protein
MKVYADEDEYYPFWTLREASSDDSARKKADYKDISDEEFAEYKRIMAEFEAWQEKLAKL